MDNLTTRPQPATDYSDASARLEALQRNEEQVVPPECRTIFLSHEEQTEQAVLCLHGMGNCPQQFQTLSLTFYELGYNVVTPRLPYHGLRPGESPNLADLTAEDLAAHADAVVDIGRGLGRRVTLVGFSVGGVMAAWAAQQRADIDQAVMIAPFFSHRVISDGLNQWITRLILRLPNLLLWRPPWAKVGGGSHPVHALPASHTLGEVVRLGLHTQALATHTPPQAEQVTMLLNPRDPVVNNRVAKALGQRWRQQGYNRLEIHDLNKAWPLSHDIIDPIVKPQNATLIHPLLTQLVSR